MITSVFLILAVISRPTNTDSVYGFVRDAVTGDALQGVTVETGAPRPGLTDRRGAYVIAAPAPGRRRLSFRRSGFGTFTVDVTVPESRSMRLDVALDPVPVTLPAITVATPPAAAYEIHGPDAAEIGLRRYASHDLRFDPLVPPDDPLLAASAEQFADGQAGALRPLRVRGGSSDQNLVLLDGLPVYGLAHLGGSAGAFDPDLVGRVDLHTAAPPAAYTGRLSSVLDVHLRQPDPNGARVDGAWDQVAFRQSLNLPIGAGGALQIGLRRSYRGLFPGDLRNAEQNGFGDALAHASFGWRHDLLSVYLIDGSDNLAFSALPHLPDELARRGNAFAWSHRTAGLVWRHDSDGHHAVTARVWDARANADIAWGLGDAREAVASAVREQGMSIELSPCDTGAPAMVGLSVSRPSTSYVLSSTGVSGGATNPALRLASAPVLAGVFGQGQWHPKPGWSMTVGLRVNSVGLRDVLLEPRVSGRWDVAPNLSLLAGYSRIHQFVQSLRNEESVLDHAVGVELPSAVGAAGQRPARADQLSGAFVAHLGARSTLRMDVYARSLRNLLIVPVDATGPFARQVAPTGSGTARGIDVELARRFDALDLRIALGAETGSRHVNGESFTPGSIRSRRLAIGAGYHLDNHTVARLAGWVAGGAATTLLIDNVDWGASGVFSVGSEIAGTPETRGFALNQDRLPAYWRVDAGLVRDWRVVALGKPGVLTTSLTVSNLFDTRNPLAFAAGAVAGPGRALYFPSRTVGVQVGWRF